jgi:hypothetical protein
MANKFKVGDHVTWNSEARPTRGQRFSSLPNRHNGFINANSFADVR